MYTSVMPYSGNNRLNKRNDFIRPIIHSLSPFAQSLPELVWSHAALVALHDDVPGAQRVQQGRQGEVRVVLGDHVVARI